MGSDHSLVITVMADPVFGDPRREGDHVVVPIDLVVVHHAEDAGRRFRLDYHFPCARIIERGAWGAINHLSETALLAFQPFGPASAQRVRRDLVMYLHDIGADRLRAAALGPTVFDLNTMVPVGTA